MRAHLLGGQFWRKYPSPAIWLDTDNSLTLTIVDNKCSAWADQTGAGLMPSVAQANPALRLSYVEGVLNGHPVLRNTSSSTQVYMESGGTLTGFNAMPAFTQVIVFSYSTVGLYQQYAAVLGSTRASRAHVIMGTGPTCYIYNGADASNNGVFEDLADGAPMVMVTVFDGSLSGNENRLKVWQNNSQRSLEFTGTIPSVSANPSKFYIANRSSFDYRLIGDIAAFGFFLAAFTPAQVSSMSSALIRKYDIS